jgi:hypothetical protein
MKGVAEAEASLTLPALGSRRRNEEAWRRCGGPAAAISSVKTWLTAALWLGGVSWLVADGVTADGGVKGRDGARRRDAAGPGVMAAAVVMKNMPG